MLTAVGSPNAVGKSRSRSAVTAGGAAGGCISEAVCNILMAAKVTHSWPREGIPAGPLNWW